MSTVEEIERAIESLPPADYSQLIAWLDERRGQEAGAMLEDALTAGKFDTIVDRALRDAAVGKRTPLEEFLRHA